MGILVVGSLHYDIMIDVPHRPVTGETVLGKKTTYKFGGKGGNQAISCAKQGQDVRFAGAVGDDANGHFLKSVLSDAGIDITHVETVQGMSSGMSVAMTDETGDYAAVVSSNANQRINWELFEYDALWKGVSMLVLQNEICPLANEKVAKEASKRGVKVCMNAAPITDVDSPVFQYVDLMVVNAVEARDLCGISVDNLDAAREAAISMTKRFNEVVVTAGEHGVAFADAMTVEGAIPAIPVELISTHGAGDCFMGALCSKISKGETLEEATRYANLVAAKHVSSCHS